MSAIGAIGDLDRSDALPAVCRRCDDGSAARPPAAAVAVPGVRRPGRRAADRHVQPGDDRGAGRLGAGWSSLMVSMPLVFAPFRALVGFRSDTHRSVLGWRRVPYIWMGTLMQFGGFAIMPFALLMLSGDTTARRSTATSAPRWPFCWSAPAAHRPRPPASHSPPTSRRRTRGRAWSSFLYVMLLLGMVGERADLRRAACAFQRDPADPGDPGRRGARNAAQHHRAVEAGSAQSRADLGQRERPEFQHVLGQIPQFRRLGPRAGGAGARHRRLSRCRIFCWSRTAPRF